MLEQKNHFCFKGGVGLGAKKIFHFFWGVYVGFTDAEKYDFKKFNMFYRDDDEIYSRGGSWRVNL